MRWWFGTAGAVLSVLTFIGLTAPAGAQPVRSRILEGFAVKQAGGNYDLELKFNVPLRLEWVSPKERGEIIRIKVDPIRVARDDTFSALASESLAIPRDLPIPISEINYDGNPSDGPFLEVRFSRSVRFEVRPGRDFRSIVVRIAGSIRRVFAVQLHSAPLAEPLPPLSSNSLIQKFRVYTVKFSKDGITWRRLRLGFFPTPSAASDAADRLRGDFPEAFALEVSEDELAAAGATTVSPPTQRPIAPTGDSVPRLPREPAPDDPVVELMDEGRRALTAGEINKAIAIFEKVASRTDDPHAREAKELLGLSRERNGQLAHAKAEYQDYLDTYPDDESAERVKQRLAALLTARAEPPEAVEPQPELKSSVDLQTFGSLFTSYRHESRYLDLFGETLADSSAFTDLFLETRVRNDAYTVRGQVSGGHRHDFITGSGEARFNALFVDVTDHQRNISGFVGRRSQSTGGVLGRFDGMRISKWFRGFEIAAVGGFPVQSATYWALDTERAFGGVSLGWDGFSDAVETEFFFIHQVREGETDRSAIGGELRYSGSNAFVYSYLDLDVHFGSLNIAQLVGNWNVTDATFLNFTIDYRNSPLLTLSSALQGQPKDSIRDLLEDFDRDLVEQLAVDRTAKSLSLTTGIRQRLNDRFQLSFDFTASELTGTSESGGVPGFDGTGFEFTYFGQLIANNLFADGDFGTLGLRAFDGSNTDIFTLSADTRVPITRNFRVNPRFRIEYRTNTTTADQFSLTPSVRLDYRFWKLRLETEAGVDWIDRLASDSEDEWGYYALASVRYDF